MRLEQFLNLSADRFPNKTALVVGEQRLTYADLLARADALRRH